MTEGYAPITPWGQLAGAVVMFGVVGFAPCYAAAALLKRLGILRVPLGIELAGLDQPERAADERAMEELLEAERDAMEQHSLALKGDSGRTA